MPRSVSAASKRANSLSIALALTSLSRNNHTVVASGTVPSIPSPRLRSNDKRSLIWNSVASSDSE